MSSSGQAPTLCAPQERERLAALKARKYPKASRRAAPSLKTIRSHASWRDTPSFRAVLSGRLAWLQEVGPAHVPRGRRGGPRGRRQRAEAAAAGPRAPAPAGAGSTGGATPQESRGLVDGGAAVGADAAAAAAAPAELPLDELHSALGLGPGAAPPAALPTPFDMPEAAEGAGAGAGLAPDVLQQLLLLAGQPRPASPFDAPELHTCAARPALGRTRAAGGAPAPAGEPGARRTTDAPCRSLPAGAEAESAACTAGGRLPEAAAPARQAVAGGSKLAAGARTDAAASAAVAAARAEAAAGRPPGAAAAESTRAGPRSSLSVPAAASCSQGTQGAMQGSWPGRQAVCVRP